MRQTTTTTRALALALLAALAAARPAPLAGQATPTEGYDPLRQITAQLVKANLLIVQDVTGSMAWDNWGFTSPQGQHNHGRLYWESQNTTPATWTSAANGTVAFNAKQVSNNTNRNVTFNNIPGVAQPGVYTYSYAGTSGPQYTCQGCTSVTPRPLVYSVQLPVLVYESSQYRLAYKCKPTGSWTAGGRVPWSTTVSWYYNNSFDFTQCSTGWGRGLYFDTPSRIMNVKNALGNSAYIASDYTPPLDPGGATTHIKRWDAATWDADWQPWRPDKTYGGPAAIEKLVYTEPYKTAGNISFPYSYKFMLDTGYDLTAAATRYDPTFTTGLAVNPAVKVNWIKDPGDPFPAYYTAATATPFNDKNGIPVKSPGQTSAGGTLPAGNWSVGWPSDPVKYGTVTIEPPADIIGKNANRVNWGLVIFNDGYGSGNGPYPYLFPIDTADTNNVERLQAFFAANQDPSGAAVYSYVPKEGYPIKTLPADYQRVQLGLTVGSSTSTKTAVSYAKSVMSTTFSGGSLADNNNTWTLPADPKKTCLRTYGVVLVTDGMSNTKNPNNGNWVVPETDTQGNRTYGDSEAPADATYNCPLRWNEYAAGEAQGVFKLKLDKGASVPTADRYIFPRVWAVGISPMVGPCELDMIAYMGRTDASSPNGDAGFSGYDPVKNPYLPQDSLPASYGAIDPSPVDGQAGTYDGPTGDRVHARQATLQRPATGTYPTTFTAGGWWNNYRGTYRAPNDGYAPWWSILTPAAPVDPATGLPNPPVTGHGHNAFFANDSKGLSDAFATIVNATAAGDYATNAPVSGMSAAQSNIVFLPSTTFPNWQGHFYAFDINKDPADLDYLAWDQKEAGQILNETPEANRKIFTWDPGNANALVEVTTANLAQLQSLSGTPGFNAAVVDFIRGNDGTGSPRAWRLGPMINSAPALVAAPPSWLQSTTVDHKPFQLANASRDPLLWVGSNDGMMHAFRVEDGVEQIALLPPSLLSIQVTLYNNYVDDPKITSGQPRDNNDHIYGVANSFRFGDVYDSNLSSYKTVGVITLGPGGNDVVAVDVTSVPRPDASPYPPSPVEILWTKTSGTNPLTQLPALNETWSIPAMAPASQSKWRLVMGSGYNPGNTATSQGTASFVAPRTYTLDPTNGTLLDTSTISSLASPAPFVGNQAFADSVIFDPKAKAYQDDNLVRLGLQADLNGRVWFMYDSVPGSLEFDTATVGIDVSTLVTQSQPLYYNPAASGYGATNAGCIAYAFGSGTLYETSGKITGAGIGTGSNFTPRLFIATNDKANMTAQVPASKIVSKVIKGNWTYTPTSGPAQTYTFGPRTQLTAPPFLLVPKSGTGKSLALFLLYDPEVGCNGYSYVVTIEFEGDGTCTPSSVTYAAYPAGVGAASGFTIAGDKVLVSKSGIGEGKRASLYEPPNITAAVGSIVTPKVKWWKELK